MLYSSLIACVLSILSSFFYAQSSFCTSTISQHPESLASFVAQCTRQPVLEILYAWTGYDIWEGASKIYNDKDKEKSPFTKTLTTEESTDVTNIIKATLNNGGIYIQRADKADATTLVKKETRYGANSTVGPVAIAQGTSVDSLALQSKTVGIIYRDYKGIHFRRFESWQNIMLPCPTDMNITSGGGGYFYGHQFEENGTRGLVTVTSRGDAGLSFMATDRMANSPCTSPIDSPDNLFKGDDGRYKGLAMPWKSNGVDFRALDFYQQNLFHCNFRPTGSIITLLHTFRWYTPNKTIKETDQNYKYSYWFRKFYDNNGTLQDIPGADNLDSSITSGPGAICYPSGPNAVDVWFAFDNGTFSFGLGKPNSQADIDANPTVNRVLCTRSHPGMRYYRYFGFWANGNTNLTNIESKVLNPAGKFCTPPFLRGKFLFWRNEWLTPTQNGTATDLFSIKFKARGDTVHVALGQKTGSARSASAAYDTAYSYALRVTNQTLTIEKQNSTTLLPVTITQGAQLLAGSDKERAYDYWLTFANGTIQFGHGTAIGENIVAQAIDPAALKNNTSFSFSSNARSVDYTDIVCAPYQPTTRTTNTTANDTQPIPGSYTQWPAAQTLQSVDQGAIIFSYRNTAETPAAESHSVMIGLRATLPTAAEIANQSVPDYQILIGSRTNTAHEILRQTNPVKLARKTNNDAILPLDTEWHDMWLLYSGGSIAYGSGSQIGMNMLGSWVDPNPIARIKYFSFTSFAPTMEFKLQSTPTLEPQRTCTTQHGTTPKWATLWQFETPNQGAFSFSALSAAATGTVQVGLTNATQSYPPYEIIINDTGKAYIRKDRLIQTNSITTLTEAQIPTGTAKQYWVAYKNGTILLGMGTNPLAPDAILLQWQDAAFNQTTSPTVSRFVFASANAQMQYSDITAQPFDAYNTALNTTTQTLIAQNTAQTQWTADPTKLILPASTIKLLYWHPTLRFTEPGKTTISCVVQKKDANPLKVLIGLNDAGAPAETPVLPLTSAAYCLTIAETGLIEIRTRMGALLATSPICAPFQKLADSTPHALWVTITTTQQGITLTFGIDTPIGSSPAYTYTITPGAGQTAGTLTYFGIGADNCAAGITEIKANQFIDATSTTTNGLLKYSWQPGWTFTQPDQGQVSFNLAAQQANNLVFAFGLGTSSAGSNASSTQLNDAVYTLALDYTGQIYLLKAPDLITKLGQVRYSDIGDLQKHTEVLKVSSTTGAPCTINYDRGRFLVKIGNTTVWSYTDPTPAPNITQFSFASLQSTALITNIITRGGESLRTIEQLLATPQELIATDSATFVSTLQTTLMERLHIKNLGYLFDVIIPAISSNQELFSGQIRVQLLGLIKDINAEPVITPAQKNTLPPLIATLTNALDYQALVALYATAIQSILGSTTPLQEPLTSNDARRILFFKKLQKITSLPSAETSKPGFLLALQNLVNGVPSAIVYTADEQKIIAQLRAMSSNETILASSQDPDTLLKTIPTIFDKNSQVDALVSFISKRHQARMNPATMPIALTAQQASLTLDLVAFLIDNRDELNSASQKNCMLILQLAKASPDITMARTAQGTNTRTIQQLMDTLSQPIPLSERITKLQNRVPGIVLTPSTDPLRQLFFSSLVTLKDSLQGITPDLIKTVQDSILNPFFALNIPANETTILTDLQAALTAIQNQNISCKAQIKLLQDTQESMKNYIEGLLVMLQGKGVTTQFAPDDFDLFLAQLEYAVDSRELIDEKDIPTLINVIKLAQLTPEFAPHSQDLNALLTEATTEHTFADRITYAKQELGIVIKRRSSTTSPQTTPDYYYKRLVEKLSRLMAAPGIKTEALFNDLEANILNPLLSLTTDSAQLSVLQTIRSTIVSTKAQIIESQKTFAYHFQAAIAQKTNTSMYISMLKNIIENERNGLISFDNTINGTTHPKTDAQIFTAALAEMIDLRDTLSAADITLLQTTINYAIYSKAYTDAELKKQLAALYDVASKPTPFVDRVQRMATQATAILSLMPTDPLRITFMKNLKTLLDAPGEKTPESLILLQNAVLTPFSKNLLQADEQVIITQLTTLAANQQETTRTAKAQIKLLQDNQESMKGYIESLLSMLQGKGVTTQFAADDFDLFLAQLAYAVDSRELIDEKDLPTLLNLIKLTQLTPEFAPHAQDLGQLLTEVTSEHTFADRIAYAKEEIALIIKRRSIAPSTQTISDYYYKRLVEKLRRLMTAPGIKTEILFTDLEANVLNPLLSLTTDPEQLSILQSIRTTLLTNKAQIIEAQKTFAYHFQAAIAQKTNISMYISMLKNIIENERNGLISFDNTVNGTTRLKTDAQTFTDALTEMVALRDTLSSADITLLQTSLNYALYSKAYSDSELKTQLAALYDTASKPTPFADRVQRAATQAASILSLLPTDPLRITFMKNLKTLLDAPGEKTPDILTLLQTAILTPFSKNLLQDDEQAIITQLTTLATTQQETTRTASYQMNQLAAQPDFAAYINGLQAIFVGKGTRVTFSANDYKTFVEHLKTITASRELLSGQLLMTAQDLINSTLLSAEFAPFSEELTACNTQIKQPFYFNERVAALSAEAKNLSSRNATADDAVLQRVCTKVGLILLAPQLNTTDKEFNDFELNVLSPLSRLALNESQKAKLEQVRNQIRSQKAQILASQTTFRYHFTFAQAQKDSTDAYITSLKNIMQKQREGSITFTGTDSVDLLTSLKELVTNRDELTPDQLATVRALISYCAYSSIYKDTPDAAVLTTLYQQTTQPIAIAQLITKYSTTLGIALGLAPNNPTRIKYFTQLENLTQNNESLTPILVQDLTTKIVTPLKDTIFNLGGTVDPREASIIQKLEAYTSIAGRKAQSVSYLLQIADDTNLNLFDYAQAVCTIMQQKGTNLTFTSDDIVKTVGALSYVTTSRELLSAQQITTLQQFIAQIIWLGTFNDATAQLQALSDTLGSLYTFSDRIKNASQELKVMILGQSNPTSNRMARFVERLKIILNATGTATPADFDALQNTILTPLQRLALPDTQKQIVADVMAKVASSKDAILSAQKTFTYNFQQAQLIQDNISNYIAALQNIITLKRQETITFELPDYRIFLDALTITGDQRDALSSNDLTNLKNTVNYTYYSKGFAENPQYQKELTALYNTLNTPVTFASRIAQYGATIAKILQLDTTNLERQRFFNKLKLLPNLDGSGEINDVEKFATTILAPLQAIPLSPAEQSVVAALTSFVATIRDQARQLSYNIKLLFGQIILAQNDTSKSSIDVLINGLNDIIIKRNSGSIIFNDTDYPQIIDMIKNLVENRELFNDGQISRVQSLIRAIQFGAGFEKYKDTLDTLYKTTAIALTFNERITKYRNALPQMNSSPTDDPSKNEFINMISSVFNAPGNRTLDMLTSLESEVLNPIKFGNFTTAQKQKLEPLSMRLAAERTKINSFAYRFNLAQSEMTLDSFYKALTLIITDYSNGTLTLSAAEYGIIMAELELQGTLRPLSPTTQSELYSLIQMVKTAPVFATRVDLKERLTALSALINTPVDPIIRSNYFIQTTMSMLSKLSTDGARNRYFALLAQFSSELSTLPAEKFNTATIKTALTDLQNAFNQYRLSTNATESEKGIMNDLIRQLQDVIVTLPAGATTPIAPDTTTPSVPTKPTIPASTTVTTQHAPTVARFYRSVPTSRFAQ